MFHSLASYTTRRDPLHGSIVFFSLFFILHFFTFSCLLIARSSRRSGVAARITGSSAKIPLEIYFHQRFPTERDDPYVESHLAGFFPVDRFVSGLFEDSSSILRYFSRASRRYGNLGRFTGA